MCTKCCPVGIKYLLNNYAAAILFRRFLLPLVVPQPRPATLGLAVVQQHLDTEPGEALRWARSFVVCRTWRGGCC